MNNYDLTKERELLARAKENKNKFNDLYKYFVNDVYRFSYSILNNQHDAEDVTSQTFTEFYKKIDEYEWRDMSLKYWLFRTVRNLSYKNLNKPVLAEFDEDFQPGEIPEISFVDEIINRDLIEKVKEEIKSLTPTEQEVINLRIWEGMQFKEIASLQDVNEAAAKRRFYRAIEKVKKGLEKKKIRSAITFPFVFTAISKVGESSAYAAPAGLLIASAGSLFLANTSMSGLTAFLTTKAGAAALVGLAALTGVGATVTGYEISKRNLEDSSKIVSATPSPTPTVSTTPTASITSVPTGTPVQPTPTDKYADYSLYEDSYIKFYYPKGYIVAVRSGFIPKDESGNNINFTGVYSIKVTSPDKSFEISHQLYPLAGDIESDSYLLSRPKEYRDFYVGNPQGYKIINLTQPLKVYDLNSKFALLKIEDKNISNTGSAQLFAKKSSDELISNLNFALPDFGGTTGDPQFQFAVNGKEITTKCGTRSDADMQKCADFLKVFFDSVVRKKSFTNADVKLSFDYPSSFSIKEGTFTPHIGTNTQFASKKVEVIKDQNTKLVIDFSTAPTGCTFPGDATEKVDALFKNTASGRNISRKKMKINNEDVVKYSEYSSDVNGSGMGCDLIILTDKKYPGFGNTAGYFFVQIKTNNVNQDLSDFDNILKSMKRL